ncbi:MAG: AsmA family protein [Gammaproteobacteria bacterium]|nr:AsmA family protein [Rhodocyclaceae bacterium]MBU3909245.1 AsmA family protein [Gammaproteobacteria bacterium]MBU3989647.1 AsmA family protein [Gammaproteobacteria bacterium]MBU4005595.1 AsmA family protein [Gammaproteobacteria bacterium]MBU4020852.1 AsmA family protein [Gammaproteobacteria bacterium]
MKTPKLIAIAGGAVLLVIVVLMGVLLASFDAARLKSELTAAVQEQTGRKLKIDGDLSLSFWPNVGVKIGRTTLSERDGDASFASLNSARVSVAVLPLLSKQVVAKTVEISGLDVTVIKRRDGTHNIDDLMIGKPPGKKVGVTEGHPRGTGETAQSATPLVVAIAGINISDAALTWRDERSDSTLKVADLDLTTGNIALDTGRRMLNVAGLTLIAQGNADAVGNAESFVLRLDAPSLTLSPERSGGQAVTLTVRLDGGGGRRTVNATLELTGLALQAEAISANELALTFDAHLATTAVKARLAAPLSVNLAKQAFAIENLAGQLTIVHPDMPMKSLKLPLTGSLHANLTKATAALSLDSRLDDSPIALRIDAADLAPLSLAFDLAIDQINVDRYLPARKNTKAASDKLDFSALRGLDVRGTVKVGALQASQVKMQDVRMQVKVADDRLDIAPHSAKLYGGSLVGALSVEADGNRVHLKQTLTGVQIQPLLNDLANTDLLAGRGNIALDVTTRGGSVDEMKKALAGTAKIALKDGAIKGINLAQRLRELKGKLAGRQDTVEPASADRQTDFSELTASFRIADGVAHNNDLRAKSPLLRLSGAGDIDIGNNRIDYLAKASVVATSRGQGGSDLAHLKGLAIPVHLHGPLDSPAWNIEVAGLAGGAVKARVEETRQQAADKLKGSLKGLLQNR